MNSTCTPLTTTRDLYDVAQLAGGLVRLVDTAVVGLLERGRLTVDDAGKLAAVGRTVHPVEAAVLDLVGPRARRTVASVRLRAEEDPRLTGVAERLVAEGLLRRSPLAGFSRSRSSHLRTAAGRRFLAEWRAAPPAGAAAEVALGGWPRMTDQVLCERVFGSPAWAPAAGERPRRYSQAALEANGHQAWAYGSSGLGGWGGDGGGGGGGFGGGDGGCGGGDGGGGGC
jgi:uncharacterized membrane protein YgcG